MTVLIQVCMYCAQPVCSFQGWNRAWHRPGRAQIKSSEWSLVWSYSQDQWRSDTPEPEETDT